jgi:hypothetical protein
MANRKIASYICCQVGGWGVVWASFVFMTQSTPLMSARIVISGMLTTHLLRHAILRFGWLDLPVGKGWPRLLRGVVVAACLYGLFRAAVYVLLGHFPNHGLWGLMKLGFTFAINSFFLIPAWTLLYCFFHYVSKDRQEKKELRRLENCLEKMETEARETGATIDQLLDSLKEIRESITDNPTRARAEITLFSQLLRKGYLEVQ